MKGHEKMARMEDILSLPVQDPPCEEFSAAHLKWVKVGGGRLGGDDIALIPFARVGDFVKGESGNAACPANFRVESRRKRAEGSVRKPRVDGYLEYTLYWCSYGPDDYRDTESIFGDNSNAKPASGKGSRPGRRHMMRGCQCHFTVKRLYTRPLIALLVYNLRNHVDKSGSPCHGILDQDAIGTRAMYAPRISEELRQKVMAMLYAGVSLDSIVQHHMEFVHKNGGPNNRDDFLTRNDVRNMERLIHSSSHQLHLVDESSVAIWSQRHSKHVFFFQEASGAEPLILGLQTDWQMQQMLHLGQNGCIASHSAFGLKKLKSPLCSLLVFDSSQNAIPVAWVISSCDASEGIHKWMGPLMERIRAKDNRWRPSAFLLDDPSFNTSVIREVFQCRVLLNLWHVRRSWIKGLMKRCLNFDVQREMFKQLGRILYCTKTGSGVRDAVEEFMQIFVDHCSFMDYFKSHCLAKLDLLVKAINTLPVASQESHAAIESYHLRLNSNFVNACHSDSRPRNDWLIHILTTEVHSLYWFDQYITETGFFEDLKDLSLSPNSWSRALLIPDTDVLLDALNPDIAKVISQTDRKLAYTLWNPGSEFSFCDCPWARRGNVCKHAIKVSLICKHRQIASPSLNAQEIKGLKDLSNSGLLPPLQSDRSVRQDDSFVFYPRTQ
uniref:SWIM-type domain-containing protein n=1 Tax=Kalanchoe fedtschenkoi TaxID=63787 RepID=A0A7N0VJI9_KALFE